MAHYNITRSCGHTVRESLIGPMAARERRMEWLRSTPCADCYRAQQNAEAEAAADAAGLPALTGTEKQVAWATTLRAAKLAEVAAFVAETVAEVERRGLMEQSAAGLATLRGLADAVARETRAAFWIDNRNASARSLLAAQQKAGTR